MADNTGIEWTEATWNPIVGCSVLTPGCTNCYAMKQAARIERMSEGAGRPSHYAGLTMPSKAGPVWTGDVRLAPERILTQPLRWRRPRTIFVNSMGDLFHEAVPDEWIDQVFAVMALCPQHVFQVLTKRSGRMRDYCNDPSTPHRIAKAMDALTTTAESVAKERIVAIDGFPGYFVTDRGRVLSERGSAQCVHCGRPVERTARARYCSKRCRQNAQYRLRTGKPMLFPATLSEMSPDVGEDGHRRVMLYRDGQADRKLLHRLVLTAFVRPAAEGEQGRHRDGDPSNNMLANLSWGNQSANWDDRRRHGDFRSYAKLTHEQAEEVRRRFKAGEAAAILGREFGISDTQARNIGQDRQWAVAPPIQWPLPNCWKGVSAEDWLRYRERWSDCAATPAALRFLSAEPLLGDLGDLDLGRVGAPEWIIVGGESGPGARPMRPDWARSIRDQCAEAGVPFFFKQWGDWHADALFFTTIRGERPPPNMRIGKRRAGRLLDGRTHDAMPADPTFAATGGLAL